MQLFSADIQKTAMMRKLLLFCFVALTLSAFAQPCTIDGVFDYARARLIVKNINNIRQSKGLKPLRMETALTEAAMLRAAESAFRYEEELDDERPEMSWLRPNGDNDLRLIAEQYNTTTPPSKYYYVHVSKEPFVNIGRVVKKMGNISDYRAAINNGTVQSIGCGAFLSPKGYYYWVLYFIPSGNSKCDVPAGQWTTQVKIAQKAGERTETVSKTKSDTDLTPHSFEVTGHFNYEKAIQVVELTNKERTSRGLKPYVMDSTLMDMAMIRAAEMKGLSEMTHTRPNDHVGTYIISSQQFGDCNLKIENIAYGQETASQVVSQWMTSPGHRDGILDENCNRMGAGECDGYWVQLFVKTKEKKPVLSKSAARVDEVTVVVTIDPLGSSKVVKRKRLR